MTALEAARLRDAIVRATLGPIPDDPLLARITDLEHKLAQARRATNYYRRQRDKWRDDARGWRFQCGRRAAR